MVSILNSSLSLSFTDDSDLEGEDSEDGSDSVIKTDIAQFQISDEKWNIVLGTSSWLLVVGTKCDLLLDNKLVNDQKKQGWYPVDTSEAESHALEQGVDYFETSSLLGTNIKEVFDILIQGKASTMPNFRYSIFHETLEWVRI